MNFGVRLPGPFRVGVSSSGRVNAGVTLGPFSASTAINQRRRPASPEEAFYPISLDGAVAELVVLGWVPRGHDGRSVFLTKYVPGRLGWLRSGWRAVQLDAVPAERSRPAGVTWRKATSRRSLVAWTVVVVAGLLLCGSLVG